MPFYFDSHCHFDFSEFDHDRAALWQQCQDAGIDRLLIPGTEPTQWQRTAKLLDQYDHWLGSAGIHPWWLNQVDAISDDLLKTWYSALDHPRCVAIGECGLDKAINTDFAKQCEFFEAHLRLACERNMPLIIHVRKSHNETLRFLQQYKPPAGGVIHGFSGSIELATNYWQLGFYLGIGGTITYPRANKTRQSVKGLPLEALLIETDAPDMPLMGHQGQRNTPLHVVDVAKTLAELRNEPLEHIAQVTTQNAKTLFQI